MKSSTYIRRATQLFSIVKDTGLTVVEAKTERATNGTIGSIVKVVGRLDVVFSVPRCASTKVPLEEGKLDEIKIKINK